jgi:hypothetical protein
MSTTDAVRARLTVSQDVPDGFVIARLVVRGLPAATGAIALPEARELERGVLEGIRAKRTCVVLDLCGVTEVGLGLLGTLLGIRREVTRRDASTHPHPPRNLMSSQRGHATPALARRTRDQHPVRPSEPSMTLVPVAALCWSRRIRSRPR